MKEQTAGVKTSLNKNCHRSPVAEFGQDWRGREPANTTDSFSSEAAKADFPYSEIPLMPAFSLLCGLQIGIIANGERLLTETVESFGLPDYARHTLKVPIPPSYRTTGLQLAIGA
ncbi:MAG: hypothetical protein WC421_06340 [Elusimicrobiales bacterium]